MGPHAQEHFILFFTILALLLWIVHWILITHCCGRMIRVQFVQEDHTINIDNRGEAAVQAFPMAGQQVTNL